MNKMIMLLSLVALAGVGCLPKTQKLERRLGTAQMSKEQVLLGKVFGKDVGQSGKNTDAPVKGDGSKPDGATDGSGSTDNPDGITDGGGVPAGQFPDGATDSSSPSPGNSGTPGNGDGSIPANGGGKPSVPSDGKNPSIPGIPTVPTNPTVPSIPSIPTVPCDPKAIPCIPTIPVVIPCDPTAIPCIPSIPAIPSIPVPTQPCDGKTSPCIPRAYPTGGICRCIPVITASPLIIDLEGDGINLSSPKAGVKFDIDGDGKLDQISWPTNASSAFIVLDRDNNGKIESVHELFGNNTVGPDNKKAANGFEALAKYDLNNDRVIDTKDAVYHQLRLWKDANHNGITDAGELVTLASLQITSIDLVYKDGLETDRYGNETRERSVVKIMVDGVEEWRMVFDIWFALKK